MWPFSLFFVSRSRYNALIREYSNMFTKYLKAKDAQFSVAQLRAISRLLDDSKKNKVVQFNKTELRDLLLLCHPDRHFNSDMSVALSQKINQLRNNL